MTHHKIDLRKTHLATDLVLDAFGRPRFQVQAGGCVGGGDDACKS